MRQAKTFSIKDSEGAEHTYECTQHPGDVGFDLMLNIQSMVGEAFGISNRTGVDVFAEALAKSGGLLLARGGHKFALTILSHTTRDGKKIDQATFRAAYQGNYNEVIKAVGLVVAHNWGGVGKLVGDLVSTAQDENAMRHTLESVANALGLDTERLTDAIEQFSTDSLGDG